MRESYGFREDENGKDGENMLCYRKMRGRKSYEK